MKDARDLMNKNEEILKKLQKTNDAWNGYPGYAEIKMAKAEEIKELPLPEDITSADAEELQSLFDKRKALRTQLSLQENSMVGSFIDEKTKQKLGEMKTQVNKALDEQRNVEIEINFKDSAKSYYNSQLQVCTSEEKMSYMTGHIGTQINEAKLKAAELERHLKVLNKNLEVGSGLGREGRNAVERRENLVKNLEMNKKLVRIFVQMLRCGCRCTPA